MQRKKEIIRNFAGIAFTTGLAISTQGSANLVLGALSGIAGNIASNFIEKVEFNKIKTLLQKTDPSDLNHDLQKIIIKAIEWSVLNIQILYKKEELNKQQIADLEKFTKSLIDEVKVLESFLSENDDKIYQIIEKPNNDDEILKTFDLKVNDFPVINSNNSYKVFFKKHFTSNLQLCFGELLKNENNRPALIAYQREVYQSLDNKIDKVILQNEEFIKTLASNQERGTVLESNKNWEKVKEKAIKIPLDKVNSEFLILLDEQLSEIKKDTELLIDITTGIKDDITKIKGITKGISVELNKNWIAKNKVWIISLFIIITLIIVGMVYKINTVPFQMNIVLEIKDNIQVHPEYPELSKEARVRFYFPKESIEKEVTFNNEIILSGISNNLKKTRCKVELIDDYWEFITDSITINKTAILLNIKPNDKLANISGKVISRDLQELIQNAKIIVNGLNTKTDKNGEFTIKIPLELRKPNYILRVEKEGYLSKEKYCVPNDFAEILISKKD